MITSLVAREILQGKFSFALFYTRRAKRLLPAAYLVLIATALASPWLLTTSELRYLSSQVIGAITFSTNVVLWQQAGYFDGPSDLKPLLHFWSLAVEEQYYMLMPAALVLIRRDAWGKWVGLAAVVSLGFCLLGLAWKPVATFYLLPTRAWEMLIGSCAALATSDLFPRARGWVQRASPLLFWPGLAVVVLLPWVPLPGAHPGPSAVAICLATAVVLMSQTEWPAIAPIRALAWVGDLSYSLYLVHWPIVAYINNAWIGDRSTQSLALRWSVLLGSIALAFVLYRLIEQPIRASRLRLSRATVASTVALSATISFGIPAYLHFGDGNRADDASLRVPNTGLGPHCDQSGELRLDRSCQSSDRPDLAVWGDSFAMHLIPGLLDSWSGAGAVQLTRSGCGPFLGAALYRPDAAATAGMYHRRWSMDCIAFNRQVLQHLSGMPHVETVVLSAALQSYLSHPSSRLMIEGPDGQPSVVELSPQALSAALNRTVSELRRLGKKVILVAPPPALDFDIGLCVERQRANLLILGRDGSCEIAAPEYQAQRRATLEFLSQVEADGRVPVVRPDRFMCDEARCQVREGTRGLYRDEGHFSIDGSRWFAGRAALAEQVKRLAR